jgi:hypothetical protein
MNIVSFGGHIHAADVPRNRASNTAAQAQVTQIAEQLKKLPAGESLPIKVTDFGRFERYALQTKLQKRGEKVQLTVSGERDKDGNIKSGTLYVVKMTDEQWKQYTAKPGNTAPAKAGAKK